MHWAQQARAAGWLTTLRVTLGNAITSGTPGQTLTRGLEVIDQVLHRHIHDTATNTTSTGTFRRTAVIPPAEYAQRLHDALTPPAPPGPGRRTDRDQPADLATFHHELKNAYLEDIKRFTRQFVDGKGEEEHQRVHSWARIGQIAAVARTWATGVFGPPPSRLPPPHRNIVDLFEQFNQMIGQMSDEQKRVRAGVELGMYWSHQAEVTKVLDKYRTTARFSPPGQPPQAKDHAVKGVLDDLIGKPGRVSGEQAENIRQVLAIVRGWPARAQPEKLWVGIQRFRPFGSQQNQVNRQLIGLLLVHEDGHLWPHPQYLAWARSLGHGTEAHNTALEGVTSLWTDVVWRSPGARDPRWRAQIEGVYARLPPLPPESMPDPATIRYPSYAQAMALGRWLGFSNLWLAVLRGRVELITGPVTASLTRSALKPLPGPGESAPGAAGFTTPVTAEVDTWLENAAEYPPGPPP
jgi:hypothetical protein